MPCPSARLTRALQDCRYPSSRNSNSVMGSTVLSDFNRNPDLRLALQPGRHLELVGAQEVRVEQLRLGARAMLGKDGDDNVAGPKILGEPHRTRDVDGRGSAKAQALMLEQVEEIGHRLGVGNHIGLVDTHIGNDRGDAPEADAFRDRAALRRLCLATGEEIIHRGAARFGNADEAVLLPLAQECGDAGDRAAGADQTDKTVDPSVRILPDLRTCRRVMRLAVVEIVPLVGKNDAVGFALAQMFGKALADMLILVRIAVGDRRYFDQLGAAETQRILLLLALRLRDHDHSAISAGAGDECQPDACVAGGAFDHDATGSQFAALFGLQDHMPCRAVLDRAARVQKLRLAEDCAAGLLGEAPQLDQWRVSNGADKAVANLHTILRTYSERQYRPPPNGRNAIVPERTGKLPTYPSLMRLIKPDSLPNALRGDRRRVEFDAEGREGVADRVGDRGGWCDRAAFPDAFDAERIERRRRMLVEHPHFRDVIRR